jgi:demethylmenaquinone methyltransferase / 2-methoxy-6-polyprenyl-1,4-benzoquinol methylase
MTMRGTVWDEERLADPHGQPDKAARVQAMFDAIAPTYERVNHILSLGMDARWRRRSVLLAKTNNSDRVLDVACGTGDFARAFAKAAPRCVIGCDFAEHMLRRAAGGGTGFTEAGFVPSAHSSLCAIRWCRADALALPFADQSFSLVSCAFGVRNFQDLAAGLREFHRVLLPCGRAVILEFSLPRSRLLGRLYQAYFNRILPGLATLLSRDRSGAYHYLPKSVSSFADSAGMTRALRTAGFERVECRTQTVGIVTVFIAWKL